MKVPDDLLEKWGQFYSSDFVKENMPHIREITFEQFVQMQMRKKTHQGGGKKDGSSNRGRDKARYEKVGT